MALKAKVPITILVILILFSLFMTSSVYNLFKKEQAENTSLKAQLSDLTAKKQVVEDKLAETEKAVASFEVMLADANEQIGVLEADLAKEKTAKEQAAVYTDKLKQEISDYQGDKIELEAKLNAAKESINNLNAQLKDMEEQKKSLESKVTDLESKIEGVELGRIVVGADTELLSDTGAGPAVVPEGKVLVVNKDYNFAVINLGVKDGVNAGDMFSVYRNDVCLGELKVEKVHDAMSASGFASADLKDKVKEGDRVVKKE